MSVSGHRDFERRLELIERGVREIEAAADAGLRATAQQLVQAVLELHGAALERLLERIHASGPDGQALIDELGRDPLVGKLLLLHSLHPLPLEARVLQAIEEVRPQVRSQRADVELLGIDDTSVRIRLVGGVGLKATVERAILDAAPDVTAIEVDTVADEAAVVGFIPLASLRGPDGARPQPGLPALVPTRGS